MERTEPEYTSLPVIPQDAELGDWVEVYAGDRIDNLARELLGDSRYWRFLAAANPQVADFLKLPPGERIFVPTLQTLDALLEGVI